jgi:hypothetical protein
VVRETPFPRNGPEYTLAGGHPERVTFYIKLGALQKGPGVGEKQNYNWGAMFALLSRRNQTGIGRNVTVALGVTFEGVVRHGADFYFNPWENKYPTYLSQVHESAVMLVLEGRQNG